MERVMKIQEVILRAISKQITWIQAAEIIGVRPRTMRRWRYRYEQHGYDGLFDRRLKRPSPKRVPLETVEKVLCLYREQYFDFNVAAYVEKLHEVHEIELSYSWVKTALQKAGLVAKKSKRGSHRKRRPRRPLVGMLLHVDGSKHAWLAGRGLQDLIVLFDDATSEVYYAQLVREESTATVMAGLKEVVQMKGVFCALYADRASHLVYTPKAGGPPQANHRTQIGRALEQLGIELIPANSPQARGRCERLFGTWQGRLPQELRLRGITSLEQANHFLREEFIDFHNRRFSVESEQEGSAFVPAYGADLEKIFSRQEHRVVGNDNIVHYQRKLLQIERQKFRYSMARCRVLVCEHLDGKLSVYYGPHLVGRYDAEGRLLAEQNQAA
jgi:transposase